MAGNKTKPTESDVNAYIDSLPDESRRKDAKTLAQWMQRATGEKPKLWGSSIVGFGSYHYIYESGREGDSPIVGFAPRKSALVLYGIREVVDSEAAHDKLGKFTTGAGCLYVKKLADVDQTALEALISQAFTSRTLRESR